jgi:hypothetical protein
VPKVKNEVIQMIERLPDDRLTLLPRGATFPLL